MSPIQSAGKLLELDDLPFIEAVYRTLLGREPDSHGLRHYLGCLRDGYGKEKIFGEIAISSEAEVHRKELLALASGEPQPTIHQVQSVGALLELDDVPFLTASYGTLLGRVPDSEGMSHYLKCLRTGYGKENILVEIANSPEATPDVMTIQGMRELVANQKKINLPIRGIFSRTSRVERQANRLENQFGRLTSRVADLEGALENLRGMFSKEIKADDSAEPQASVTIKEHTEANAVVIHAIQRVTFAEQELTPIAARPGFEAGVIDGLKTPLEAVGRYLVRGSK